MDPARRGPLRGRLEQSKVGPESAFQRYSIEQYEDFVRSTADWTWEVDDNLNYISVSREVARVFGIPSQLLIGTYLFSLTYFKRLDRALISTVESIEDRVSFRNRPLTLNDVRGNKRSILLSGVPVFDPASGRFAGYRGTGLDIAGHGPPLEESDDLAGLFEDFAELVSAWRWEADSGLRISELSEGYTSYAGLSREHSLGRAFTDLWQLHQAGREAVRERALFRDNHSIWTHGELEEERHFVIAGKPVIHADGRFLGYRGLGADITPQMTAAGNLAGTGPDPSDAIDRVKSEFLANVGHELRTPLSAIIGFSDAMRSEALGPLRNKKYLQYAEDIHGSARYLLDIVGEILDLSRLDAGTMPMEERAVDVSDLIDSCCRMLEDEIQKAGLELVREVAADLPNLRADPVKLKQILLNLLSNAIKFTPHGGTVAVAAAINKSGRLEMEVWDTGIGIKASDIPKVLSRFGQSAPVAPNQGGVGLGLPITKELIELHGGTFRILSGNDGGTRAVAEFPEERLLEDDGEAKPWKVLF